MEMAPKPDGSQAASGGEHPPAGAPITGWRQTFSSLSGNRDFTLLYIGNIAFFFGMNIMITLRGWLVIDRWDNAALLGYIMATVALPMIIISPIGGVISDRMDRRKLVLFAQASLVVSNAVVAGLILTDAIKFWHLLVLSPFSGAAFALNMPARQAMVATLVPREKLMNAMALSAAGMNASRVIGPPVAGLMIKFADVGPAYVASTVFYGVALLAMFAVPPAPPTREREFTFAEDFVGGFSYIRRTPLLMGLLLFATVPMVFALPYQVLLPVFAERVWNVGSIGFGLLQGVGGIGGLIGALFVANMDSYPKKSRLLLGGALAFGAFLALFAISPSFYLALFFMGLVGVGSMIVMTVNNTAIQLIIPDEVRGRVMSVLAMSFGMMPLGAVPAAIIAESAGAPVVVAVSSLMFVSTVVLIFVAFPAFRTLDRELADSRAREMARRAAPATSGQGAGAFSPGSAR